MMKMYEYEYWSTDQEWHTQSWVNNTWRQPLFLFPHIVLSKMMQCGFVSLHSSPISVSHHLSLNTALLPDLGLSFCCISFGRTACATC